MTKAILGASLAALAVALTALAASAQTIAAKNSYSSPLPFFKDLKAWDPAYKAPRATDGHADLQGIWSTASLTTMSRGGQNGTGGFGLVIPDQKIKELTENSYYNKRLDADNKRTDTSSGAGDGKGGGDVKGYNNFWIDPGSEYGKVNGEWRSSWITAPDNGQVPYTAAGRAARGSRMSNFRTVKNTGPEIRPLGERCIASFGSQAGPPLNNAMYNNNIQIVQSKTAIILDVEMNHDARIIRMDDGGAGKARPAAMKQWFGDSVGHWEGDTLVVETRNFSDLQNQIGAFPLSDKGVVTERFTRVADDQIDYKFTVSDPVYYSSPWSGEIPLRKSKERIFEYACHEGNYALPGILRGDAQGRDTAIDKEGE